MPHKKTAITLMLISHLSINTTQAQTTSRADYERAQQERIDAQREQQIEQTRQRQTTPTPEPQRNRTTNTTPVEATACQRITHITLQSPSNTHRASHLPNKIIQQLTQRASEHTRTWNANCVQLAQLIDLQNDLGNWLITQGYSTSRISIPDQNISTGTLILTPSAGWIANIAAKPHNIPSLALLMPTMRGNPFKQQDADQALENLKRLPSQANTTIELTPAEQANASTLTYITHPIKFKDRINGQIGIDNSGTRGNGRNQITAALSIDAPLQLLDQLTINAGSNADFNKKDRGDNNRKYYYNHNYGVYWDIPIGYAALQIGTTQSHYRRTDIGYIDPIRYTGASRRYFADVSYVAYRDRAHKSTVNARLNRSITRNYANDDELDVQRKDYYYGQLGWNHRYYGKSAQYSGEIQYTFGIPRRSRAVGYIMDEPKWNGRFHILNANLTVYRPQKWGYYQATIKAQYASKPTPDAELFSIGNRYTVRGTDESSTLTDTDGAYIRNEWGYQWRANHSLYLGMDGGVVFGTRSKYLDKQTLIGSVLGAKGQYHQIGYDLAIGYPLRHPDYMQQKHPSFTGSLNWQF